MKHLVFCVTFLFFSCVHAIPLNDSLKNEETKITDLNYDVQNIIFADLPLRDLVSIAHSHSNLSVMAVEVFKQKFSKRTIKLVNYYFNQSSQRAHFWHDKFPTIGEVIVVESEDMIIIQHLDTIHKVIEYFGSSITKLAVEYSQSALEVSQTSEKIGQLIGTHCSASLVELDIINTNGVFFKLWTTPFEALKRLSIGGKYGMFDNPILPMDKLFPAIHTLSLPTMPRANFIEKIQHLNDLHIALWPAHPVVAESILKMNPQIRSLNASFCMQRLLNFIGSNLSHLESIELHHYYNGGDYFEYDPNEMVTLDNVKSLTMSQGESSMPDNFRVPNVTEFTTDAQPMHCFKWIEFVHSSLHLRKLSVIKTALNEVQIDTLANGDLNAMEVNLILEKEVRVETIVIFMKKCTKIETMRLLMEDRIIDPVVETLKDEFANKWTITANGNEILIKSKLNQS